MSRRCEDRFKTWFQAIFGSGIRLFMYCCFRVLWKKDIYKQEITPENGLDYVMLWTRIFEYKLLLRYVTRLSYDLSIFFPELMKHEVYTLIASNDIVGSGYYLQRCAIWLGPPNRCKPLLSSVIDLVVSVWYYLLTWMVYLQLIVCHRFSCFKIVFIYSSTESFQHTDIPYVDEY